MKIKILSFIINFCFFFKKKGGEEETFSKIFIRRGREIVMLTNELPQLSFVSVNLIKSNDILIFECFLAISNNNHFKTLVCLI